MKKSSKRIVISTQAKNKVGFRTRTAGINLEGFTKNPLLLWMHKRPKGESKDEVLPLGYWDDVQLNGEELSGIPVFDDKDAFAMQIYNKVENGTIKMASAGLEVGEFKEDDKGEVWLWNSTLFEASLCDIGSNPEAMAVSLYNENHELVTLSEVYTKTTNTNTTMKILLTALQANLLNLAEGAEMDANEVVTKLVTLAGNQAEKIVTLTEAKQTAEQALADKNAEVVTAEKQTLLTAAVAKGQITKDHEPLLLKMDKEDLVVFLSKAPENPSVASQLAGGKGAADKKVEALLKLTYDELDKSNQLPSLKEANPEAFAEKFEEKFGRAYKG